MAFYCLKNTFNQSQIWNKSVLYTINKKETICKVVSKFFRLAVDCLRRSKFLFFLLLLTNLTSSFWDTSSTKNDLFWLNLALKKSRVKMFFWRFQQFLELSKNIYELQFTRLAIKNPNNLSLLIYISLLFVCQKYSISLADGVANGIKKEKSSLP